MLNRIANAVRKFLYISLHLLLTQVAVSAQNTIALTLDDAIKFALDDNAQLQIAKTDEQIAASQFKETNALFIPQVAFSYTAFSSNNPLNAFGFKLQQQSITQIDFDPKLLNNPSSTTDFTTKLDLKLPLVNMDAYYMRKSAERQMDIYQYKTQRSKEYISFQVQQVYLQLQMAYEAEKVLEEALQTAKSVYHFTNDRFAHGLLQKSDLLNAQVAVSSIESNMADTKSNIRNASDMLSQLMGKEKGTVYTVSKMVDQTTMALIDSLPTNRADFKAMETAISSYDLMIQSNKMSKLPKLNAFASYQLNDNTAFGFGSNAYLAGIQLSWDIFKGTATKNKINTQLLERNKLQQQLDNQLEESKLELNKAYRQLADAKTKMSQRQTSVNQASEALRILKDRYEQGLINTTDVLLAQTQLSQQKLAYVQAEFESKMANAYIKFLTITN